MARPESCAALNAVLNILKRGVRRRVDSTRRILTGEMLTIPIKVEGCWTLVYFRQYWQRCLAQQ